MEESVVMYSIVIQKLYNQYSNIPVFINRRLLLSIFSDTENKYYLPNF